MQSAPFVCYLDEAGFNDIETAEHAWTAGRDLSGPPEQALMGCTTQDAMRAGMGS